jgi:hypothetical protein
VALWDRREMRSLHHTVALATGETFERRFSDSFCARTNDRTEAPLCY